MEGVGNVMNLPERIARADGPSLAVSGLACLDRCLPLLGGDVGDDDVLRPLWTSLAQEPPDAAPWSERLATARAALCGGHGPGERGRPFALARGMLDSAPAVLPPSGADRAVRDWADDCSVAALRIHLLLDVAVRDSVPVAEPRTGRTGVMSPLLAAELRRQNRILDLLAARGSGAMRQVLEASTEGRRVLRAVVSRQARGSAEPPTTA